MCNLGQYPAPRFDRDCGHSAAGTNAVIRDCVMSTSQNCGNVRRYPHSATKLRTARRALNASQASCLILAILAGCSSSKAGSPAIETESVATVVASPGRDLTAISATPESQQSPEGMNTRESSTPSPDVDNTKVAGSKATPAAIDSTTGKASSKTTVANKTGDLDNSVHDAGIIFAPNGPIVVVVMSDQVEDREAIVNLIQHIALLTFQAESF